jgi:hypothetical protein
MKNPVISCSFKAFSAVIDGSRQRLVNQLVPFMLYPSQWYLVKNKTL